MEFTSMIISFVVLMFIICGVIIFVLHRALIAGTEGAVNRLNEEIAKTNAKQQELNQKLREADDELQQRRKEAKELAEKMRSEAEEQSKAEREKIISKARQEAEEIIAKAQGSKEQIRKDLEKEFDIRAIDFSIQILNKVLSQKAKGVLGEILMSEFLENLKNTDMSKISPDIKRAEVVTLAPIDSNMKSQIGQIIKSKLNREVEITSKTDESIAGGVVLKFGSMALDGSLISFMKETAIGLQETVDKR